MCFWIVFLTVNKEHKWPSDFHLQLCWRRQEKKASPKSSDSTSQKQLIQDESSGFSILSVTFIITSLSLYCCPSIPIFPGVLSLTFLKAFLSDITSICRTQRLLCPKDSPLQAPAEHSLQFQDA